MATDQTDIAGFTLSSEGISVLVSKVYTSKGERVAISHPEAGETIELDPLELESITWHTPMYFEDLFENGSGPITEARGVDPDRSDQAGRPLDGTDEVRISNEFAIAKIALIETDNNESAVIDSSRLEYTIELNARQLAGIARLDHDSFSEFLETPFGPEA